MRKCVRCGCEMQEGRGIKVEGGGFGIVIVEDETKCFPKRFGKPRVAVCPECGEISLYMDVSGQE